MAEVLALGRLANPISVIWALAHVMVVLLGFLVTTIRDPLATGIGASLIAAGATGLVIYVYVALTSSIQDQVGLILEYGIRAAFDGRSVQIKKEYDVRLANAADRIDILGFGLKAMRQDYISRFPEWVNRATVRILMIDPEYPSPTNSFAKQRDREERQAVGEIGGDVRAFARDLGTSPAAAHLGGKLKVRLYRCLPSVNIFRVDDELFWGPYLMGRPSRNTATILVRRGLLFNQLLDHFDAIWNSNDLSRDIPPDWLAER